MIGYGRSPRLLVVIAGFFFPSPPVGEGGRDAQHRGRVRGSVSADRDPSSGADFVRATFSHKGRREESNDPVRDE